MLVRRKLRQIPRQKICSGSWRATFLGFLPTKASSMRCDCLLFLSTMIGCNSYLIQHKLWETLTTSTIFKSLPENTHPSDNVRWTFDPPTPPAPSPLLESLNNLSAALPRDTKTKTTALQHTLQSLSVLTGYISAQVYVPFRPYSASGPSNSGNTPPTPAEELKREIRALKGLVLNR